MKMSIFLYISLYFAWSCDFRKVFQDGICMAVRSFEFKTVYPKLALVSKAKIGARTKFRIRC